jgi:hydrogenase nickel incorporation protein HypB
MCGFCGCGGDAEIKIINLQTGVETPLIDETHSNVDARGHHDHALVHRHSHVDPHLHDHIHAHPHDHSHSHEHHHDEAGLHDQGTHNQHVQRRDTLSVIQEIETQILAKNDALAAVNRGWFAGREILALNLVSSPGAGKTALLERTIRDLGRELSILVIEGDQATARDGERIRAAGADAVQVNTGSGCHLEANMISRGLSELKPPVGSVVMIENVGNLVCPAMFDLGERSKIVILSVTEGDDKPLKYPHMFRAADIMIVNKIDLLPYVDFNVDVAVGNASKVNPDIIAFEVSALTGEGLEGWYAWLRRTAAATKQQASGREMCNAPAVL